MARGRTNPALVTRVDGDGTRRRVPVRLLVEEAMDVRLEDRLVATLVRTPGHDYELAVGHLFGGGLIGLGPVHEVRYCATGSAVETGFNVVSVVATRVGTRADVTTVPAVPFDPAVGISVAAAVAAGRELLHATGTGSAAAAFAAATGEVRVLREDASLLHALDKVVGRLHLDGRLPAADVEGGRLGVYVSGAVDADVVDRAVGAGFGVVLGAGAATSLAVAAADRAGITLVGGVEAGAGSATLYHGAAGA